MTLVMHVTDLAIGPRRNVPDDIEVDEQDEISAVAVVDVEFSWSKIASARVYVPVVVEWTGAAAATGAAAVSSRIRARGSTANLDIEVPPFEMGWRDACGVRAGGQGDTPRSSNWIRSSSSSNC